MAWVCLHLEVDQHPSDSKFDLYCDCLTNISQDGIDKFVMSDDEHDEDFEGF